MLPHVTSAPALGAPVPRAGAAPVRHPAAACPHRCDRIAPRPSRGVPAAPPPKRIVDGTPEVLAAAVLLGGAPLGSEAVATGVGAATRSAGSYLARLGAAIVTCVSDPAKTGEHIAEGVVGGAAWAAAAAGVSALADAARSQYRHVP